MTDTDVHNEFAVLHLYSGAYTHSDFSIYCYVPHLPEQYLELKNKIL